MQPSKPTVVSSSSANRVGANSAGPTWCDFVSANPGHPTIIAPKLQRGKRMGPKAASHREPIHSLSPARRPRCPTPATNLEGNLHAIGDHGLARFRQEHMLSPFFVMNRVSVDNVCRVHTASSLVDLLTGCYEQLDNVEEILETIIQVNFTQDSVLISALNDEMSNYAVFANLRVAVTADVNRFSGLFYVQWKEIPGSSKSEPVTLAAIVDAIAVGLNEEECRKQGAKLKAMKEYFQDVLPATCFPPPIVHWRLDGAGRSEMFNARCVATHGIASNGQFMFVLCDGGFLQMVPLVNTGAMMPIITRELGKPFGPDTSVIATERKLRIYSGSEMRTYNIADIMRKEPKFVEAEISPEYICFLSDGVSIAKFQKEANGEYWVTVLQEDTVIRKVKLHGKKAHLNRAVRDLIPDVNYNAIPMEMNGSFLAFVFRINQREAVYRVFSLITGHHIVDETFACPEALYAVTHDVFNRCHWSVMMVVPGRMVVRRFYFHGSLNPSLLWFEYKVMLKKNRRLATMIEEMNNVMMHYAGTQLVPHFYLFETTDDIYNLIELTKKAAGMKHQDVVVIQVLVILIDMNMRKMRTGVKIRDVLHELMDVLPTHLAVFLFFQSLRFVMYESTQKALELLINLFERSLEFRMIAWVAWKAECFDFLAVIPFVKESAFSALIPDKGTPDENNSIDVMEARESLLFIHQRSLISVTIKFLSVQRDGRVHGTDGVRSPLDDLHDYTVHLLGKAIKAVQSLERFLDLENALIFRLLFNFMNLLSSVSCYYTVAASLIDPFSALFRAMKKVIEEKRVDVGEGLYISIWTKVLMFLYGRFAATLMKSVPASDFERKFSWLLSADVPDAVIPKEDYKYSAKEMNAFVANKEAMDKIYKMWKSAMNRRLSDDVKHMDKLVIITFANHLQIVRELLSPGDTLSAELKACLDQMLRIRNVYRNLIQKGDNKHEGLIRRTRLLQLMKIPGDVDTRQLADFVCYDEDAAKVVALLKQQENRGRLIELSFDVVRDLLSMRAGMSGQLITDIMSFILSQVQKFEPIFAVGKIVEGIERSSIMLFKQILVHIKRNPNSRLILVSFRLFRDCGLKNLRNMFLTELLKVFFSAESKGNKALFALGLLLIESLDELPAVLKEDVNQSPMGWLLIAISLKNIQADVSFYDKFREIFWHSEGNMRRIAARVMFNVLNSTKIPEKTVRGELVKIVREIGNNFLTFNEQKIVIANEMTWMARRILAEKTHAQPILMSILKATMKHDVVMLTGLFAIVGGTFETVRPYCNIKYHMDRSSVVDYIAVPMGDQRTQFVCYTRPFVLKERTYTIRVDRQILVYAVPVVSLTPDSFSDLSFILSFFDPIFENLASITAVLYVQTLAHFLAFDEFRMKITPEMVGKLFQTPLPFHSIEDNVNQVRNVQNLARSEPLCGFDTISFRGIPFVTYLSPQVNNRATVKVSVTATGWTDRQVGYFGIVSDTVERYFTRYSLLSIPDGVFYPLFQRHEPIGNPADFSFEVQMKNRRLVYGSKGLIPFPVGDKMKIMIALPTNVSVSITVEDSEKVFVPEGVPTICEHGATQAGNMEKLFNMPDFVYKITRLPKPRELPSVTALVEPIAIHHKLRFHFVEPPSRVSIHCGFATSVSPALVKNTVSGLFKTISLQFTTVCLMRIIKAKPELALNPTKLFSLMVVALEPFSRSAVQAKLFPFSLAKPVWEKSNFLYLSLESDAKDCIQSMLTVESLRVKISKDILRMSESRSLHMVAYPHNNHTYIHPMANNGIIGVNSAYAVLTLNSFMPFRTVTMEAGEKMIIPMIISQGPTEVRFGPDIKGNDVSVFIISSLDNSFAFDTGFEVLLLLKNMLFVVGSREEKMDLKSAFLDLIIAQSPIIFHYLPQFINFLGSRVPPSPSDIAPHYFHRLCIMGTLVKTGFYSPLFDTFLSQEGVVLNNPKFMELIKHFPEFGNGAIDPPPSKMCKLTGVSLDPGTVKNDFVTLLTSFRLFTRQYTSLVGFPFWIVLPYWLRISGAWRISGSVEVLDALDPTCTKLKHDIVKLSNPGYAPATATVRYSGAGRPPPESRLFVATTPTFENMEVLTWRQLSHGLQLGPRAQIFLTWLDLAGGWSKVHVSIRGHQTQAPPPPEDIDMSMIHDEFLSDMKEFAMNWSEKDSEELNMLMPRYALNQPSFMAVEAIARGASLCQRFSSNVVVLRALILHHVNYIRWTNNKEVPPELWDSMRSLLSAEEASIYVTSSIQVTQQENPALFSINRRAAQGLVVAGRGNPVHSIICQLTVQFMKFPVAAFQGKRRPWKITFVGEMAIDAGGPARELILEAAASIFEPTTGLVVPVPNARRADGLYKDTFIPFERTLTRHQDYRTIGHFIGIVVRTGLFQDLPFAPLVWKYIAAEKIDDSDILEIDAALSDHFNSIREEAANDNFGKRTTINWTMDHWDGTIVTLPGHSPDALVKSSEIERFIRECIQFRIWTIKPVLHMIRIGFRENVGFKKHPLLTGSLLSRMAQGNGLIIAAHLKSITVYTDYSGEVDPMIARFWKAVDRFDPEQMKLLLKFITTLTRLPNATINPDFRIQIDRLSTKTVDESLPTASTCFNRLHLPIYSSDEICYEKLLYAIQFCQTMENK